MLELAGATASDLSFTAETVTSTLSQFNLDAANSGRVSNVFAAAISKSQATMNKLADSMRYVGPVAAGFGKSMEETTAALMALYNAGFKGEQAGTILRKAFSDLANPVGAAKEIIEQYGLSLDRLSPEMNDFADIIDYLAEKGITSADALKLFGAEAGPGMITLLRGGGAALREYQDAITDTAAATEMYAKQNDTLAGDQDMLKSAMENLAIVMTRSFEPMMRGITQGLTSVVSTIAGIPAPVRIAAVSFLAFAAGVGPVMALTVAMLKLKASMIAVGAASMVNPVMAIMGALAAVVATITIIKNAQAEVERRNNAIVEQAGQIAEKYTEEKKAVRDLAGQIEDLSKKTERTVGEQRKLEGLIADLKKKFPGMTDEVIAQALKYGKLADEVERLNREKAKEELAASKKPLIDAKVKELESLWRLQQQAEQARARANEGAARVGMTPEIRQIIESARLYEDAIEKRRGVINDLQNKIDEIDQMMVDLDTKTIKTINDDSGGTGEPKPKPPLQGERLRLLDEQYKQEIKLADTTGEDKAKIEAQWYSARLKLLKDFIADDTKNGKMSLEQSLASVLAGGQGTIEGELRKTAGNLAALGVQSASELFDGFLDEYQNGVKEVSERLAKGIITEEDKDAAIQRLQNTFLSAAAVLDFDQITEEQKEKFTELKDAFFTMPTEPSIFESMVEEQKRLKESLLETRTALIQAEKAYTDALATGQTSDADSYGAIIKSLKERIRQLEEALGKKSVDVLGVLNTANQYIGIANNVAKAVRDGAVQGWENVDWSKMTQDLAPGLSAGIGGIVALLAGADPLKGMQIGRAVGDAIGGLASLGSLVFETINAEMNAEIKAWAESIGKETGEEMTARIMQEFRDGLPDELKDFSHDLIDSLTSGFASGNWDDIGNTIDAKLREFVVNKILASKGFAQQMEGLMNQMLGTIGDSNKEKYDKKQKEVDYAKQMRDQFAGQASVYAKYAAELAEVKKRYEAGYVTVSGLTLTWDLKSRWADEARMKELEAQMSGLKDKVDTYSYWVHEYNKLQAELAAIDPNIVQEIDFSNLDADKVKALVEKYGEQIKPLLEKLGLLPSDFDAIAESFTSSMENALINAVSADDFESFKKTMSENLKKSLIENLKTMDWYKNRLAAINDAYRLAMLDGFVGANEAEYIRELYRALFEEIKGAADFSGIDAIFGGEEIEVKQTVQGVQLTRLTGTDRDYFAELFKSFAFSIETVMASKEFTGYMDFANAEIAQISATQVIINSVTVHNGVVNITAADGADLRGVIAEMITEAQP